ncbi:MAG: hypothetical protein WAN61_03050 [Minisyncoccia bacterium]
MQTWKFGYEKSKKIAKKIYSKIGRIPCPAFGNEIVSFTSEGFSHLIRKGRIPRTRNEQKKRFALIPYIEEIIKNPRAEITFRQTEEKYIVNRHGENILLSSIANFWTFHAHIQECDIKLVIRQIGQGQKQFQSIMSDTIKIGRGKNKKSS